MPRYKSKPALDTGVGSLLKVRLRFRRAHLLRGTGARGRPHADMHRGPQNSCARAPHQSSIWCCGVCLRATVGACSAPRGCSGSGPGCQCFAACGIPGGRQGKGACEVAVSDDGHHRGHKRADRARRPPWASRKFAQLDRFCQRLRAHTRQRCACSQLRGDALTAPTGRMQCVRYGGCQLVYRPEE